MKPALPFLVAAVAATLALKHHRAQGAAPLPIGRHAVGGIGLALERKDGRFLVHSLAEGFPAARCRMIRPGDELLALRSGSRREVKVKGLEFEIVVDLIRGEPGEPVELKLRQPGHAAPVRVTLVRERILVDD